MQLVAKAESRDVREQPPGSCAHSREACDSFASVCRYDVCYALSDSSNARTVGLSFAVCVINGERIVSRPENVLCCTIAPTRNAVSNVVSESAKLNAAYAAVRRSSGLALPAMT